MNAAQLLAHFETISEAPNAVARLRRLILDLAVRGKLVPQDKLDEPASDLLKRIRTERARLSSLGEIRKAKSLRMITETPFDVPLNWCWVCIRDITSDRGQEIPSGPFTYLDVSSIDNERGVVSAPQVLTAVDAPSRARKVTRLNDVIYSCVRPYLLNVAVITENFDPPAIASTAFAVLNGYGLVVPRYLWVVLRSPFIVGCVESAQRGQAYPAINDADFALLPFPLPPLSEQHRIVARVEELMALCDLLETQQKEQEVCRDRLTVASFARLSAANPKTVGKYARFVLDTLPTFTVRLQQLRQLRQTILNLAVRGKLVRQDPQDEPASSLLQRIGADRTGTSGGRRALDKDFPLTHDPIDAPFDLPDGWAWARFPELGTFGRGKSKHRPRNDPTLFAGGKHPLIQTGDVARSKGIIATYTSMYNEAGLKQSLKWPKGTLCITIAANIADSGILSFEACFPDSVVGFVPYKAFENARYFEYFVRTAKANLLEFAPATAQKNINLDVLNAVLIPLPPLSEQNRIVAEVDRLMELCNQLESSLRLEDESREGLLTSILADALGPDEDQDEAA